MWVDLTDGMIAVASAYCKVSEMTSRSPGYKMLNKSQWGQACLLTLKGQPDLLWKWNIAVIAINKSDPKSSRRTAETKPETTKLIQAMAKSAAHAVGSQIGRQIIRGVLGSIFGSGRRR